MIKASIMHEHKPEFATILAFDVNLTKEGADMAKELNVKIFTAGRLPACTQAQPLVSSMPTNAVQLTTQC